MKEQSNINQEWNHVVTMEELGELKRKFNITYDSKGVSMAMDKAAKNLSKQVQMKGFRKGKAPAHLIKKMFQKEVRELASLMLSQEGFLHACFENKVQPMGQPDVLSTSFENNGQFYCELSVEVRPTIVPMGYLGIGLTKQESDVNQIVSKEIETLRKMWAKEIPKEEIENGNVVELDFVLKYEDKELTSGKDQKFEVLEQNEMPFGKNLFGLKVGDFYVEEQVIPEGFEDASNKTGTIEITVKGVFTKEPLDDDGLCKQLQVETFDEALAKIENSVRRHLATKEREGLEEQIVDKLVELHEFDVPKGWVSDEKKFLQQRLNLESVDEELDKKLYELSLRNIKRSFILDAIGDVEKIQVSEEEINGFIQQQAEQSNISTLIVKKELREKNMLDNVVMSIRQRKIMDFILSQAQIVEENDQVQEEVASSFDIPDNPME